MLVIRREQWEALRAERVAEFERAAYERYAQVWPDKLAAEGRRAVEARIKLAVGKTTQYGISKSGDINRFIDLMVNWGDHFDTEREWAAEILGWAQTDATTRMQALQARGVSERQRMRWIDRNS